MSFIAIWAFLKNSWVGKAIAIGLGLLALYGMKRVYDGNRREEGRVEVKAKVQVEAEKAQTKMQKAGAEYRKDGGAQSALEKGEF